MHIEIIFMHMVTGCYRIFFLRYDCFQSVTCCVSINLEMAQIEIAKKCKHANIMNSFYAHDIQVSYSYVCVSTNWLTRAWCNRHHKRSNCIVWFNMIHQKFSRSFWSSGSTALLQNHGHHLPEITRTWPLPRVKGLPFQISSHLQYVAFD